MNSEIGRLLVPCLHDDDLDRERDVVARAVLAWLPASIILCCAMMKRSNRLRDLSAWNSAVIGISLVLGFVLAMSSIPVLAGVVDFSDPGLEAAVREAISKPIGDILDTDLIGLTTLDARYHNIVSLEGIEHCVNLTELDLYGNKIVDITALSGLHKLTKLSLEDNEILGISPLSGLANLATLYLDNNQIVDISPLSGLTSLTTLFLWENDVVDISPLSGLTNLNGLYLYFNHIVDISPLSSLTQLTGLGLSWNQIVDISPLSSLTNLMWLYLDNNAIVYIAALVSNAGIDSGDRIHLQGNRLLLESGSPNMLDIEALQDRGIDVDYSPQN